MAKTTFASVIKNPGFKYLWTNQILLQVAYNSLNFSLLIWVFRLTNSVLAGTALMLSIMIPAILFGLFAGVVVDISDRKKIIIATDLTLAITFVAFIFLRHSFLAVIFLSFIFNTVLQFFVPAEGSAIPLLVKKEQLLLANSLFQTTLFGTLVVGYSLAGPIISFFGISTIFIVGAIAVFCGFLVSQRLPKIKSSITKSEKKLALHLLQFNFEDAWQVVSGQIKETFTFIRGKLPVAVAIVVLAGVQGVVATLAVLIPAYMERVMHIRATDASFVIMFPLGLGMVIGAFLIGKFAQGVPRRALVTKGIIIAGVVIALIGLAPIIGQEFSTLDLGERFLHGRRSFLHAPSLSGFLAILAFLLGFSTVAVIIPSQTVLQEYTPENKRGKIFSVLAVFMAAFSSLPVIIAGGLSDLIGVKPVMMLVGVVLLLLGFLGYRPAFFFAEHRLPFRVREFLGLGHWGKQLNNPS